MSESDMQWDRGVRATVVEVGVTEGLLGVVIVEGSMGPRCFSVRLLERGKSKGDAFEKDSSCCLVCVGFGEGECYCGRLTFWQRLLYRARWMDGFVSPCCVLSFMAQQLFTQDIFSH